MLLELAIIAAAGRFPWANLARGPLSCLFLLGLLHPDSYSILAAMPIINFFTTVLGVDTQSVDSLFNSLVNLHLAATYYVWR